MAEPVTLELTVWIMLLLQPQEFWQSWMTGQHLLA